MQQQKDQKSQSYVTAEILDYHLAKTSLYTCQYTLCLKKRDPDIFDCNFGKD